jgi:chromosome segregation ATPase
MKKRGFDSRQEPGSAPRSNNRVDRVFAPAGVATRPPVSQIANDLLATSRTATPEAADTELSLRRQMSRLQRQLAESQRELANKDDELAAEVEKRLQTARELEEQREHEREMQGKLDELLAYEARTAGIELRLQDSIATADELGQKNEAERASTAAALARADELNLSFEENRALWNAEREVLHERHAAEIAQLEEARKDAIDAGVDALDAQAARLRESHDAALGELRDMHVQSLATLRGDLEPKVLQAHTLAEERERLVAEIASVRSDAAREAVERDETHKRELAQRTEAHAAELATIARTHAADVARAIAECDEQIFSLQQAVRSADTREALQTVETETLRHNVKTVQREAAELKERVATLEVDKRSVEEALERDREVIEMLIEEQKALQQQLEASTNEARRNALERHRFVAYLEEGLALLGALPPESTKD